MQISEYFPFWEKLTEDQKDALTNAVTAKSVKKGTVLHNGSEDCVGLFIVTKGQLRAYILSEEGKEITLYRLLERDMCLFSGACMMNSIQFDISVEAETETEILHIPTAVYQKLMTESVAVANFTNEIMASRFSDVMWLLDQILYKRMDSRIAAFLLEESGFEENRELKITHETIARHLGSAREVITRILKYLQSEGLVKLSRGGITVVDEKRLEEMASDSLR